MAKAKITIVQTQAYTVDPDKKISVTKFLQLYPQDNMIAANLKRIYRTQVKTVSEWNQAIDELLNTRI